MLMDNVGYCYLCDKDVSYSVSEEDTTLSPGGIVISIRAEVARCNVCGERVYCPELDDKIIEIGYEKYLQAKKALALG
jgi:YgiT-type zinc finger domain-containing protein